MSLTHFTFAGLFEIHNELYGQLDNNSYFWNIMRGEDILP